MEFVFAGLAGHVWEGKVGTVEDGVANGTTFHSFKVFVQVILPEEQCINEIAVSRQQQGGHGQYPTAPSGFLDTHAMGANHFHWSQRVGCGNIELNYC